MLVVNFQNKKTVETTLKQTKETGKYIKPENYSVITQTVALNAKSVNTKPLYMALRK